LREAAPPTMYVPYMQRPVRGGVVFEVRTAGDPLSAIGAIREAVRKIDPNLPLVDVSTQMEQVEQRFMQEKLFAQAYTLFGGLALLVASGGLFGLMSYSVARRTNEIGIRMALGAQREDVLRLVLRESMTLVSVGVVVGLVAALATSRLVATLLFGLAPTDARSIALALTAMIAVSALAAYLPARRASRVDPMIALHYE
jgi:ABC-type antimicrobial peptide transport system permease subunit